MGYATGSHCIHLLSISGYVPKFANSLARIEPRNGLLLCANHHQDFEHFRAFVRYVPSVSCHPRTGLDSFSWAAVEGIRLGRIPFVLCPERQAVHSPTLRTPWQATAIGRRPLICTFLLYFQYTRTHRAWPQPVRLHGGYRRGCQFHRPSNAVVVPFILGHRPVKPCPAGSSWCSEQRRR